MRATSARSIVGASGNASSPMNRHPVAVDSNAPALIMRRTCSSMKSGFPAVTSSNRSLECSRQDCTVDERAEQVLSVRAR